MELQRPKYDLKWNCTVAMLEVGHGTDRQTDRQTH